MDTLTTIGMLPDDVRISISITETCYPDRKQQNDQFRKWLAKGDNHSRLLVAYPKMDIEAAYLSTCRNDILNCGACALSSAIRRLT